MLKLICYFERFLIINFFPLFFLTVSIMFFKMVGFIFTISALFSLTIGIILSFSYKKKYKLFNIAKYYVINNKSFEYIGNHFFDNPCSNVILIFILLRYEKNSNVFKKYNFLKNSSRYNLI